MNPGKPKEPGGERRRHYDETYQRHAVELTLQGTRTVRAIAQELGVSASRLYAWRQLYAPRPGAEVGAPQSLEAANEEIARLRGEVLRLRERETVLKKSLGILSETPGSGMPGSKR